jgi:hypothetical protein
MKPLSPAFSPNWMAGSVLTTTNPVLTTNPAITPVRNGPYADPVYGRATCLPMLGAFIT